MRTSQRTRGFTLLEILIVCSIIALLSALSFKALVAFKSDRALDADVHGILALLDEARRTTLSAKSLSQYGVHFETNTVVLFKGATYSSTDPNNRDAGLSGETSITAINLSGGTSNVVFARLTGEVAAQGEITIGLKKDPSLTKTIKIYATGISEEK
jgi:prepilin-type N-terminal cleavage/methylation domain-containing protein